MTYSISVYAFSQQFMMKFPPSPPPPPPPLSNIFVSKQKFQMRFLQSKLTDRHIEREKLCTRIIANVSFQFAYILREKCVCCAKSTYFKLFTHWKLNISQTAEKKKICFIDENNIRHYRKKTSTNFAKLELFAFFEMFIWAHTPSTYYVYPLLICCSTVVIQKQ